MEPTSGADLPAEAELVGARLDRATEHFAAFGAAWAAHLERRPHRMSLEVDEHGGGRILFHRLLQPPADLSILLGEFLYELRAALDNCLYAVAVIDSGQNPPPKAGALEWPICTTVEQWEQHRARRLSALCSELQDGLLSIQPFQVEWPGWNVLRILNDMARVDRHRAVHFVTSCAVKGSVRLDQTLVSDFTPKAGPIGPDGVVATFTWHGDADPTPADLDGDYEFEVEVAGVESVPGPPRSRISRPYGSLEQRLRALHAIVSQYCDALLAEAIAIRRERDST